MLWEAICPYRKRHYAFAAPNVKLRLEIEAFDAHWKGGNQLPAFWFIIIKRIVWQRLHENLSILGVAFTLNRYSCP